MRTPNAPAARTAPATRASRPGRLAWALAALALAAAAGCNRTDPPQTTGQKVDSAIEQSKDKLAEVKASAGEAAQATATVIGDSAITANVKAQLAADPELTLLGILVETQSGRTTLTGSAPNEAARQRATKIAAAVNGVGSVDNALAVRP